MLDRRSICQSVSQPSKEHIPKNIPFPCMAIGNVAFFSLKGCSFDGDMMPYTFELRIIFMSFLHSALFLMFIPFSHQCCSSHWRSFPEVWKESVGHPSEEMKNAKEEKLLGLKFYAGSTCKRGLFRFHIVPIFSRIKRC